MVGSARRKTGDSWLDKLPTDIFGSDVFVDYQGTYVWQANQVGHFAIGFALTSLISWAARGGSAAYYLGLAVIAAYAVKEYIDLLIAEHQAQDFFPYDKGELWADMAADTWFVTSGVLTALAAHWDPIAGLLMAVVVVIIFLLLRKVFLPAKESLDRTALPYIFRLANFPKTEGMREHNAHRIRAFITGEPVEGFEPSPAVLIQGHRGTGKTSLAVGIGSEIAVRKDPSNRQHGRSIYFTAFGLFEEATPRAGDKARTIKSRKPRLLGTGRPWSLKEADCVIIDDVDSGSALYGGDTPEQIIGRIKSRPEIHNILKAKKTVWVTGTSQFQGKNAPRGWSAWMRALADLYDCKVDDTRQGDTPAEIQTREPIPVIWLTQPIKTA